jgi:hypothetical protein
MKNFFKNSVIIVLFVFASMLSFAQSNDSKENHGNALNILVGFGDDTTIYGFYEFALTPDLTASPSAFIKFGDNSDFALGGRFDYYFDRLLKLPNPWDIYAGVDAEIYFDSGNFDFNAHFGTEYIFNEKIGIIAEFGAGSYISGALGVGIHF